MAKPSRKVTTLDKRSKEEQGSVPEALRSISLPRSLDLHSFVEARMSELEHFLQILGDKSQGKMSNKRNFQLLPKHMRRRAMSHNAHRIPARIRSQGKDLAQLKNPCRKSRRHYVKIMQDYTKRNLKALWLESHIWHAKRMQMVEKWGYKVAWKCTDKGIRAAYRFARDSSVIYDQSYSICLKILDQFKFEDLFSVSFPEKFRKKVLLKYNTQLLGLADILSTNHEGILLIHPSYYSELKQILLEHNIQFEDFKDQTCVFSLRGPRSTEMLTLALDIQDSTSLCLLKESAKFHNFKFPDGALISVNIHKKFRFSQNKVYEQVLNSKSFVPEQPSMQLLKVLFDWPEDLYDFKFWENFDGSVAVTSHLPEKITTRSARSRYPKPGKSEKPQIRPESSVLDSRKNQEDEHMQLDKPENKILDKEIQELDLNRPENTVLDEEIKEMELDKPEKFTEISQALLIYNKSKHGDGWDVILKAGENNSVWRSFIYSGCKAVGLQEFKSISYEQAELFFPNDFPACQAYETHSNELAKSKILEYFKKPSSKRMNFERIASPFPFFSDWKLGKVEKRRFDELVCVKVKCGNRYAKDLAYICLPDSEDFGKKVIKEQLAERVERNSKWTAEYVYKLADMKVSRRIIGFVTSGGFSFRRCRGFGIGFVAKEEVEEFPAKVLFRNPTSQFYHFCKLKRHTLSVG